MSRFEVFRDVDGCEIKLRRNARGYIELYSADTGRSIVNGHPLYPCEARKMAEALKKMAEDMEAGE